MDSPSNRVVHIPERDPVTLQSIPDPLGGDSGTSIGETVLNIIRQAGHIASAVTAAVPEPVLEALIHRAERGHPATRTPELRAGTPEQARIAIAPAAFGVLEPIPVAGLFGYAVLGYFVWRMLR